MDSAWRKALLEGGFSHSRVTRTCKFEPRACRLYTDTGSSFDDEFLDRTSAAARARLPSPASASPTRVEKRRKDSTLSLGKQERREVLLTPGDDDDGNSQAGFLTHDRPDGTASWHRLSAEQGTPSRVHLSLVSVWREC
jgi:hypothetical protein